MAKTATEKKSIKVKEEMAGKRAAEGRCWCCGAAGAFIVIDKDAGGKFNRCTACGAGQ